MNSRQKFHVISIAAIVSTILLIHTLNKKEPVAQTPEVATLSNRFIMIYEASWGLNCNDFIRQTLLSRRAKTPPPGEKPNYNDGQANDLKLQERNNVLLTLSNLCNTKETCEFKATSKLLGEPYRTCNKILEISYRCFEYDRLHTIKTNESRNVHIDCREQQEEVSN